MALSYLENEYDQAMLELRINLPNAFEAMNCFLTGMTRKEGAEYMGLSQRQYKDQLEYARISLRKRFAERHLTANLMMDNRMLTPEVSAKLHFMFPEEP